MLAWNHHFSSLVFAAITQRVPGDSGLFQRVGIRLGLILRKILINQSRAASQKTSLRGRFCLFLSELSKDNATRVSDQSPHLRMLIQKLVQKQRMLTQKLTQMRLKVDTKVDTECWHKSTKTLKCIKMLAQMLLQIHNVDTNVVQMLIQMLTQISCKPTARIWTVEQHCRHVRRPASKS